jgi:hypothetical protein
MSLTSASKVCLWQWRNWNTRTEPGSNSLSEMAQLLSRVEAPATAHGDRSPRWPILRVWFTWQKAFLIQSPLFYELIPEMFRATFRAD